ncbi:hypothetical protein, partial [Halomonas sp. DQ26W]|uniref:hypothetical protein n=1 Tax=Halomonas sp. DQ26W TaxID=2282311 RepID=UPI001C69E246
PAGEPPALLRFYLSRVIKRLHVETEAGWHRSLFGGIEQWWSGCMGEPSRSSNVAMNLKDTM